MKHIRSTLCYQGLQEKFTKKEKALKTSRVALIEEISTRCHEWNSVSTTTLPFSGGWSTNVPHHQYNGCCRLAILSIQDGQYEQDLQTAALSNRPSPVKSLNNAWIGSTTDLTSRKENYVTMISRSETGSPPAVCFLWNSSFTLISSVYCHGEIQNLEI
jgi:hypothetical protein